MIVRHWRCPRCRGTRATSDQYRACVCDCGARMVEDKRYDNATRTGVARSGGRAPAEADAGTIPTTQEAGQ